MEQIYWEQFNNFMRRWTRNNERAFEGKRLLGSAEEFCGVAEVLCHFWLQFACSLFWWWANRKSGCFLWVIVIT